MININAVITHARTNEHTSLPLLGLLSEPKIVDTKCKKCIIYLMEGRNKTYGCERVLCKMQLW